MRHLLVNAAQMALDAHNYVPLSSAAQATLDVETFRKADKRKSMDEGESQDSSKKSKGVSGTIESDLMQRESGFARFLHEEPGILLASSSSGSLRTSGASSKSARRARAPWPLLVVTGVFPSSRLI